MDVWPIRQRGIGHAIRAPVSVTEGTDPCKGQLHGALNTTLPDPPARHNRRSRARHGNCVRRSHVEDAEAAQVRSGWAVAEPRRGNRLRRRVAFCKPGRVLFPHQRRGRGMRGSLCRTDGLWSARLASGCTCNAPCRGQVHSRRGYSTNSMMSATASIPACAHFSSASGVAPDTATPP